MSFLNQNHADKIEWNKIKYYKDEELRRIKKIKIETANQFPVCVLDSYSTA